jgi:hypothetical protein
MEDRRILKKCRSVWIRFVKLVEHEIELLEERNADNAHPIEASNTQLF